MSEFTEYVILNEYNFLTVSFEYRPSINVSTKINKFVWFRFSHNRRRFNVISNVN